MTSELPVQRVSALDPEFGPMAAAAGRYAIELPGLTAREKAFVWIASDLCSGHLGLPFELHITVARQAGAGSASLREVLRHLAPYVGYPAVVEAFARLNEVLGEDVDTVPRLRKVVVAPDLPAPPPVDPEFDSWVADQAQRWHNPLLSHRERALLCVAVDVLQQTLDAPMRHHIETALAGGADEVALRALLRLMSELAMGKVWQAFRALDSHLAELRR